MTNQQIVTNCLKKMFRVVGLRYPCPEFTDQDDWWTKKTWTAKQEANFKKWMKIYLMKHMHLSARAADREISWFNLMWGWKIGGTI